MYWLYTYALCLLLCGIFIAVSRESSAISIPFKFEIARAWLPLIGPLIWSWSGLAWIN